jgi:hypothetical protein
MAGFVKGDVVVIPFPFSRRTIGSFFIVQAICSQARPPVSSRSSWRFWGGRMVGIEAWKRCRGKAG